MLVSKKQATVIEKMNKLANVTVTDEKVRFSIDYSDHSVAVKQIPG